ncbi:MAG TPA: putative zinc-binding metallopeptidase [Propionibacteriaceae bacterium]|nr:putative zinc-binding metallopeptidase [Propionibacteriaceae bacterium]
MRAFQCEVCRAELFFENSVCVTCGSAVGYSREHGTMVTVSAERPICANLDRCGCNWIADPTSAVGLCFSCRLTRTRPADGDAVGLSQYWVAEAAKRRLVFGLDELELPIKIRDGSVGLAFDLLSSSYSKIMTGHQNGVITLDLAESSDAHREALRESMDEPYRTVLGHFRHEIGHYYCEMLALTPDRREEFRALFGDETTSYEEALQRHYSRGAGRDWGQDRFISAYATMHPLEDFAEVFGHFLHIADTLQTAAEFGLMSHLGQGSGVSSLQGLSAKPRIGLLQKPMTEVIARIWLPLTKGLNQINRSMGKPDLYPFVLAGPVIAKLSFVWDLVAHAGSVPQ